MDKGYYKEYYKLERSHWWFTARMNILEDQVDRIKGDSKEEFSILNIGVATGATSKMLEKHGQVTSVEFDADCCEFLRDKLQMEVTEASATDLPFGDNEFDMVCAFDVLEHIDDHTTAASEINRVTKHGGNIFLTVPAHNFLWSEHDEINHHFRRYSVSEFKNLIESSGSSIEFFTSFNFWLFFPIAAVRLVKGIFEKKKKNDSPKSDFDNFEAKGLINSLLYRIFMSENFFLKNSVKLPIGVSLLCMAEKK